MRVAVTGATGMLGRYVVADLLAAGYEVLGIDQRRPSEGHGAFVQADIGDLGQLCSALHGADALIHLAAIPSLHGQIPGVVFTNNVIGTFNALEAAALLGIPKVVTASSASALGVAYAYVHPVALQYVPLDEAHPLLPQEAYGLSKQLGEEICAAFHRRTGGRAISFRFPLIWDSQRLPDLLDHFSHDDERGRHTLWSYLEVRDAARACRLALEATGLTHEAFYVTTPETCARYPSAQLAQKYYPGITMRRDEGYWSFFDCSLAERLLGFTAEYHWRPTL